MTHPRPISTGDVVTTRLRPSLGKRGSHDSSDGRCSNDSPEAIPGCGRHSHDSAEANPRRETVMTRSRPIPGGRRSHGSPVANLGRERQSQLARGQLGMAIIHKLETRQASDLMGAGTSEDFDPCVQPALDPKFHGCGFLFQCG